MITTRETDSLAFLRDLGVQPRGGLAFGPDGCFGIDVRDDAAAEAFLEKNALLPGEFITVTLRTNTPKLHTSGGDALNPAKPTAADEAQDARWAATLRALIVDWIERTGLKVLLVPEMNKEIAPARRLLLEPLPASIRERVVHRETFWNVDEAASIYARAHTVVSMEPHSCIIAIANGTPTLHLHSRKHGVKAGMFRDLGVPEWLIDIDKATASDSIAALRAIAEDHPGACAKATATKIAVDTRSLEVITHLSRLVA